MAEQYNCPNCGAPIGYSDRCEYCETVLRWTPMTCVEFVPKHLNVREAAVATSIPLEHIESIEMSTILRQLAKDMVAFILENKAFTLTVSDDPRSFSRVVKMRTYIGMENR